MAESFIDFSFVKKYTINIQNTLLHYTSYGLDIKETVKQMDLDK
jgi:hypothetical protein